MPYKAYMALTNVKTLQLWKFCNTVAPYIHRVLSEDNTTVCITYPTNNRGVNHDNVLSEDCLRVNQEGILSEVFVVAVFISNEDFIV